MSVTEGLVYLFAAVLLAAVVAFARYTIGNARLLRESMGHRSMASGAIILAAALVIGGLFLAGIYTGTFAFYTMVTVWVAGITLVIVGGLFHIKTLRKFYTSLSSVFMLKIMRLFAIGMIATVFALPLLILDFTETAIGEYGWYAIASLGLQTFALACLAFAERKYYVVSKLSPAREKSEAQLPRGDSKVLEAYLSFTKGLISRATQAIDASSIENILSRCAEEHPILLANYKQSGEILDFGVLSKNLNQIHETERDQELTQTFACINSELIDLFAVVISPARTTEIVVAAVEAERDNLALWSSGVPLGKYNEIVYERELLLQLPEGVAEREKTLTCTYLVFKRALEPLIKEFKRAAIRKIELYLEDAAGKPPMAKIKISEDGTFDLNPLYKHLASMKPDAGMKESALVFSSLLSAAYAVAKDDIGIKRANLILSNAFTELLHKHYGFMQQCGVTEAIPKGVEIPSEYRLPGLGKSYLIESRSPDRAFKIFGDMIRRGFSGLCISTLPPAEVKKKYEPMDRANLFWLSKVEVEYAVSPSNLGILRDKILATMTKAKKSVILLEGLEYLATTNGFDLTLKLLHDIREAAVIHQAILILPIAPKAFDTKHLELLERYMEVIGEKEEKT